ncbi:hypothetical protein [Flavobacterium sp. N1736]|uniref:hypothetical protein n=1 Tax=Flavobacterium sp. N1736 TaxID=2986823 RepID=UPI0022247900|nr:hypothetical protein [Flavobacterium sp. N1736]
MKSTLFYLAVVFLLNCSNKNDSEFLEVFYIGPNVSTPMSYSCSMLSKGILKEEINYKKIVDKNMYEKLISLSNTYKESNESDRINARIKVLIHYKNKVDTLCFGEHFDTYKNGVKVTDNKEILTFVKKMIDYENTVPAIVRQHPERYGVKK